MKHGLLGKVRALLASAAHDLLEREEAQPVSRPPASLAEARALLRDQLGLLYVDQRACEREAAAATADLAGLDDKAAFAVANNREDLARAAFTHRDTLEQRITDAHESRAAIVRQIDVIERALAALSHAETAPNAAGLATQLAELDRLMQADVTPTQTKEG